MLVGLYISTDDKISKDLVNMLKEKFQGIEFITLKDLGQDINMATLAKGSFDMVVVYVGAFTGYKSDRIIEELTSLKAYKDLRAHNVRIKMVDKFNPDTGSGILEVAYRKFFGGFVDCNYYLKENFNGSILVELIRDVDIRDDYFEDRGRKKEVNASLVSALSGTTGQIPVEIVRESGKVESDKINQVQEEKIEQEEDKEKVELVKIEKSKEKKKSGFGFPFFGKKKGFRVAEPKLVDTQESINPVEENIKDVTESRIEKPGSVNDVLSNISDEDISEFYYGSNNEEVVAEQPIQSKNVRNPKYKEVDSAVSRSPEVVEQDNLKFKKVDDFDSTNLFEIPTELSNSEVLFKKQIELKELELKARIMEAQAQVKTAELETSQRSYLMSPVRVDEEKVNGYVNTNRGRSKVILVTGLQYSGKTTCCKLIGEILKELAFTIDVDLDFENRSLSESFSGLDESEFTRLGAFRSLRDLNRIGEYTVPVDGSLDVIGTLNSLSEAEENSLEKRLDTSLIQPMLRKISNNGVYGFVVVDCPLELIKKSKELLDVSDYVIWACRGSRHGIKTMVNELSKPEYDEFFLNKLTIVLNGEKNQSTNWKRFFNTSSMWGDDIADSLGAIIPYIDGYDEYFWKDITGLELKDFRTNILEVFELI